MRCTPYTWPLSASCPQHFILIVRLPLTTLLLTSSPLSLILTLTLVRPASFLFPLWGAYRDCFQVFLSLCVFFPSGFTRGGLVTHNLSSLPGLAFFFNQLSDHRDTRRRYTVSSRRWRSCSYTAINDSSLASSMARSSALTSSRPIVPRVRTQRYWMPRAERVRRCDVGRLRGSEPCSR
jgi:hypothetical protein